METPSNAPQSSTNARKPGSAHSDERAVPGPLGPGPAALLALIPAGRTYGRGAIREIAAPLELNASQFGQRMRRLIVVGALEFVDKPHKGDARYRRTS